MNENVLCFRSIFDNDFTDRVRKLPIDPTNGMINSYRFMTLDDHGNKRKQFTCIVLTCSQ